MARRMAQFYPTRVNMRVASMSYTGNIEGAGIIYADLSTPNALSAALILSAQSVSSGSSTSTFAAGFVNSEAQMGRYGRGVQVVLSGAGTGTVNIDGRDYLGQKMRENIALNGNTPVLGLKAFRYIDTVTWPTVGAVTMDVGTTNVLGVPFKLIGIIQEMKAGIVAANAGTFVAGLATATAATATNADVRGTYTPATVLPDGARRLELRYTADSANLHGNAQFSA